MNKLNSPMEETVLFHFLDNGILDSLLIFIVVLWSNLSYIFHIKFKSLFLDSVSNYWKKDYFLWMDKALLNVIFIHLCFQILQSPCRILRQVVTVLIFIHQEIFIVRIHFKLPDKNLRLLSLAKMTKSFKICVLLVTI